MVQKVSLKHTLQQLYANCAGVRLTNNAIGDLDEASIVSALVDPDQSASASRVLATLRFVEQQIKSIEHQVLGRMQDQSPYRELTSVPGIGVVLGLTIALETGPIARFASAGQYASYCRCVPTAYWSNAKQKGRGNVRNGNKYLSWAFAEAANFCIRYCPEAKATYQRLAARTSKPSAYRAMANKLAKASYFIMRDQSVFDVTRLFSG